jgi:hypothetical protein
MIHNIYHTFNIRLVYIMQSGAEGAVEAEDWISQTETTGADKVRHTRL